MDEWPKRAFALVNSWGKPVFGLVFWGSVGGAFLQEAFPDLKPMTAQAIGGSLGLAAGLIARHRKGWL
ncbi:MAG: hypothetical protein P8K76_09370 [Candidatus Binatia bacterium]|nr:hypothetical protein [Candidatus Binatia bacterium]MDG1959963.1 hypothetical protein [Candidatus Binatia bacterium]MDG2009976.1 hypothetical protein [Candidatus Binatia bacterium]